MQSGDKKYNKWSLEFITENPGINPLMGWESSTDTYSELKLEFNNKESSLLESQVVTNFFKSVTHVSISPLSLAKANKDLAYLNVNLEFFIF